MNDHNLDDLIIDDVEPQQNQKTKSFLTIIALAIVVLIVAIIFTKIMLKTSQPEQLTFEQDETEMLSPDLTLQSKPKTSTEISEPVQPVEDETVEEDSTVELTEETVSDLSETAINAPEASKPVAETTETMVDKVSKTVQDLVEEADTPDTEPTPAPMPKPTEEKSTDVLEVVEEAPVQTPSTQKVVSETPKETIKKTEEAIVDHAMQRPNSRPLNVITRPQSVSTAHTGRYYIQVGAFRQTPSQRFLATIKRSGFNYLITKPSASGLKKLLIGPYSNRQSADNALVSVKDRINKSAFVIKK